MKKRYYETPYSRAMPWSHAENGGGPKSQRTTEINSAPSARGQVMISKNVEPDKRHRMADTNKCLEVHRTTRTAPIPRTTLTSATKTTSTTTPTFTTRTSRTTRTTTDRTTQMVPGTGKVNSKTIHQRVHSAVEGDTQGAPVGNYTADLRRGSR